MFQKCPACDGWGSRVDHAYFNADGSGTTGNLPPARVTCVACGGKGIVGFADMAPYLPVDPSFPWPIFGTPWTGPNSASKSSIQCLVDHHGQPCPGYP